MTRIYLIRHGESIGNASGIYLGHSDWDLSPLGYRQAEETAKTLSWVSFSAVYSSDLSRAMHTALPHAKMRGLDVVPSLKLREINIGEWEMTKIKVLLEDERFTKGWRENFGLFTFPGGENVGDASERVYGFIEEIAKRHDGETVAVVFHAAALRSFWCRVLGLPKSEWASATAFPTNASYSIVEYDNGMFRALEYSCDKHLSDITRLP